MMMGKVGVAVMVGIVGIVGWIYKATRPPLPKIFTVDSNRVKLRDGRYLAYREAGVSKEKARFKIVVVHAFNIAKDIYLNVSQEFLEELQIYALFFDRSGYGESDPNPKRFVESEALDIEELADSLELGSKFYLMGMSMGGYPVWSCLKYIPHRLAGVALVTPHVNYYWPGFPSKVIGDGFRTLPLRDQWSLRVAHYAPWLFNLYMTQKWFPVFNVTNGSPDIFSRADLDVLKMLAEVPNVNEEKIRQQGYYYCLYQDIMAGHGKWGFGPMDIPNPFPNKEGSVHLWHGKEDKIIPCEVIRYITNRIDWIKYHELPDAGHMFFFTRTGMETILRELFLG